MIPFLTYPLALIALAGVPALAAIYILRNRFRKRSVSSLVLWRFQVQSKSSGAKIHRLQLPLLFFLELLALVMLVTAASGPHWQLPRSTRPLIVVLDNSFSMRAVQDGVSSRSRALDFLKSLFRNQAPPATRLILAGSDPRSLGTNVKSWREIDELLPQWKCWSASASIDSAITLASEIGRQQANILVLTDHKPNSEHISNRRLEWHAFGQAVDNLAFANASRTAFSDQDRCLLEIANYSAAAHPATLLIQTGPTNVQRSELLIGAHQSQRLVFNIPSTTPLLNARIGNDALAEDNEVQLLPQARHHVRVAVLLTNQTLAKLVNHTLDTTGLRSTLSQDPELIIQDSDAPTGSNCWNLCWQGQQATNAYTGPFIVDTTQPATPGISLAGIVWSASDLTNAPGEVPVILAGNTPLLSTRQDSLGRFHISLNLNPDLSTLENTPDWPILFWNILNWRINEMPGLKENNARLGEEVLLKTSEAAVTIRPPNGEPKSFAKTGNGLAIETPEPGIYSISIGTETNRLSVNPLAADESDLSTCTTGSWGKWSETAEHRLEQSSLVWIFGLLALGLLVTHLYLVTTAKGGR